MKRTLRAALLLLLALAAFATAGVALLRHRADHNPRYADVVSIAESAAYQDPTLIERAWALPVAALYRSGFEYQANPSFCGPTSAANVVRSQGGASDQNRVLEGSGLRTFMGLLLPAGVDLDQEAALLRYATGSRVTAFRDLTLDEFRAHLARTNDVDVRYVVNFSRAPLWGVGHGHFSPILGYLEDEDLVFVGDVNADFGPFFVSPARLLEAMNTTDSATQLSRGLILVEQRRAL